MDKAAKSRSLQIGVLTGVTALVGGIEPAAADVMLSDAFGTINVNANNAFRLSGNFSGSGTDPTMFNLFDTQGGIRELTGVTITVTTGSSTVEASVSGSCASGSAGTNCLGNATNDSSFSVAISIAGASFLPANQPLSAVASDNCTILGPNTACQFSDSADSASSPSQFTFTATVPELSQFVGPGTFTVTPTINLTGPFSLTSEGSIFETSLTATAHTDWSGTIDVAYQFSAVNGVPEPASWLLVGGALAGLGFARRKFQRE